MSLLHSPAFLLAIRHTSRLPFWRPWYARRGGSKALRGREATEYRSAWLPQGTALKIRPMLLWSVELGNGTERASSVGRCHEGSQNRGGLTAKIHSACDGRGRPLGFVLTDGNAADCTLFEESRTPSRSAAPGPVSPGPGRTTSWATRATAPTKYVPACAQTRDRPHHPRTPRPTCQPIPTRPLRGQTPRLRQAALQAPQRPRKLSSSTARSPHGSTSPRVLPGSHRIVWLKPL